MGDRAVGAYDLERRLGGGGFGEVWVGVHRETGARHALKLLDAALVNPGRIARECEALARLEAHPNAVRVHGSFTADGHTVVVMELVEGVDLGAVLARDGPLSPEEAARIVGAAGLAVAHAHRRGVLHRDLKPSNVVMDAHGRPRLIDLGLAQVTGTERLTRTGELLGTPASMAPEQALGLPATERTDVFGLGALLLQCLTARPPRSGAGLDLLRQACEEPLPDPRRLRREVPAPYAELVLCATALDPAARFPTVGSFLAALDEARAGRSPARRARRRARLVVATASLLALGLVPGALVASRVEAGAEREVAAAEQALEEAAAGWGLGTLRGALDLAALAPHERAAGAAARGVLPWSRARVARAARARDALAALRALGEEPGWLDGVRPVGLEAVVACRLARAGRLDEARAALARAAAAGEPGGLLAGARLRLAAAGLLRGDGADEATLEELGAALPAVAPVGSELSAELHAALVAGQARFVSDPARRVQEPAALRLAAGARYAALEALWRRAGLEPGALVAARLAALDLPANVDVWLQVLRAGIQEDLQARGPEGCRAAGSRLAALLQTGARPVGPLLHAGVLELQRGLVRDVDAGRSGAGQAARVLCLVEAYRWYGYDRTPSRVFEDWLARANPSTTSPELELAVARLRPWLPTLRKILELDPGLLPLCPESRLLAVAAAAQAAKEVRADLPAVVRASRTALGLVPGTLDELRLTGELDPPLRFAVAAEVAAALSEALRNAPDADRAGAGELARHLEQLARGGLEEAAGHPEETELVTANVRLAFFAADLCVQAGDPARARPLREALLTIMNDRWRSERHDTMIQLALDNLREGRLDEARRAAEVAVEATKARDDGDLLCFARVALASVLLAQEAPAAQVEEELRQATIAVSGVDDPPGRSRTPAARAYARTGGESGRVAVFVALRAGQLELARQRLDEARRLDQALRERAPGWFAEAERALRP